MVEFFDIIIIIIFLHGLGCWTCSGIDALPSFPGVSTIFSPSRFVVEGVTELVFSLHNFVRAPHSEQEVLHLPLPN